MAWNLYVDKLSFLGLEDRGWFLLDVAAALHCHLASASFGSPTVGILEVSAANLQIRDPNCLVKSSKSSTVESVWMQSLHMPCQYVNTKKKVCNTLIIWRWEKSLKDWQSTLYKNKKFRKFTLCKDSPGRYPHSSMLPAFFISVTLLSNFLIVSHPNDSICHYLETENLSESCIDFRFHANYVKVRCSSVLTQVDSK